METFYETYKFLLLELSYNEVVKRMDDPKFKRLITGEDSLEKMVPFLKHAYVTLRSTIIKSIPHDIPEKDKANALNWVITRIVKDNPDYPENRFFIRNPSDSNQRGHDALKKQLELFYQIKQQRMDRLLPKKAIEQYNSFQEFVKSIEEIAPSYREYLAQKTEKSTKGEGQLLVYEDDNWQIYFPRTKGAACSLGKGTDWCTAAPGLDYYDHYAKDGQLIIFISKKNPGEKYQLHYNSKQFMDKDDVSMPHIQFMLLNKILADNVLNTEYSQLLSKEDKEEIKAAAERIQAIDKDYALMDYVDEDGWNIKVVYNIKTLKTENPYGLAYKMHKEKYNQIYFINPKHPDNTDNIERLQIHSRNNIFTYNLMNRDELGTPSQEIYTNNHDHPLFNMAYFNTYKDLPESERPDIKDPSLIMRFTRGYEVGEGNARMVKELPDLSKYMTLGIDKK